MRRVLSLALCLVLCLGLFGCQFAPEPTVPPTTAAPPTEATSEPTTEPTTEPVTEPITEPETEPVTEPETRPEPVELPDRATPLFWHAVSENGGELWLLGTIHVADDRTNALPDEIWAAYDEADALAVECDIVAFMEKEMVYALPMSRLMIYSDFSSITEHIAPETYEAAKAALEGIGQYQTALDMMKPMVWASFLEDAYTNASGLVSDQGVDMVLLTKAHEIGKEVREVESVMGQYEMLFGFSDEIQEYFLEDMLSTTRAEYAADLQMLYALWCRGDLEELSEELLSEGEMGEDVDPAYLEAMEDYNNQMITQRNALMADTAAAYLEAGDHVFYAVGLAHMLGDDGIVALLEGMGYTVELVQYG